METSLFNKPGPYEFRFLDKENESAKNNFHEVV